MKRIICLFLCFAMCVCFLACEKEREEVDLSSENILDYVFIDLEFGDLGISENMAVTRDEEYYLTCMLTITIKPKKDYAFSDASVTCALNEGDEWTPLKKRAEKQTLFNSANDWSGTIKLDKEGYGEATVFLFCYSDTYDKMHPSSIQWECSAVGASGIAIER